MNKKKAKRGRPAQTAQTDPATIGGPLHARSRSRRPGRRASRAAKATNKPAVLEKWYRKKRKRPDRPDRAPESAKTLTPDQARREYFTFMGRTAFYGALKRKEIPSVRIGKRLFVPRAAIEHLLLSCEQPAGNDEPTPPPPPLSQRRKGPIAPKGMRFRHKTRVPLNFEYVVPPHRTRKKKTTRGAGK